MTQMYDVNRQDSRQGTHQDNRPESERPISTIVTDLWEKAEMLLRQEMRLGLTEAEEKVNDLKVELAAKASQLKVELAAKALGGVVLFMGLLSIVAAVILLLSRVMAPWVAALIVGVGISVAGFVLLKRAMRLPEPPKPGQLVPHRTIESLKQDAQTITEATK